MFGDSLSALTGSLRFAGGLTSRAVDGGVAEDVLATYNDGSACPGACGLGRWNACRAQRRSDNVESCRTRPVFVPMLDELIEWMLQPQPCPASRRFAVRP